MPVECPFVDGSASSLPEGFTITTSHSLASTPSGFRVVHTTGIPWAFAARAVITAPLERPDSAGQMTTISSGLYFPPTFNPSWLLKSIG